MGGVRQLRDRSVYRDSAYNVRVLPRLLPHPRRLRLAWRAGGGPGTGAGAGASGGAASALHVWELVPPDDRYVGLGMMASVGPDPPPADAARCVPRAWCEPAAARDVQPVWGGEASAGPGPGGEVRGGLWRMRDSGLLVAARVGEAPAAAAGAGADAPRPVWWVLRRDLLRGDVRVEEVTPRPLLEALFKPT